MLDLAILLSRVWLTEIVNNVRTDVCALGRETLVSNNTGDIHACRLVTAASSISIAMVAIYFTIESCRCGENVANLRLADVAGGTICFLLWICTLIYTVTQWITGLKNSRLDGIQNDEKNGTALLVVVICLCLLTWVSRL